MNKISDKNLYTLEQPINSTEYLPLTSNKNFYNEKMYQISDRYTML